MKGIVQAVKRRMHKEEKEQRHSSSHNTGHSKSPTNNNTQDGSHHGPSDTSTPYSVTPESPGDFTTSSRKDSPSPAGRTSLATAGSSSSPSSAGRGPQNSDVSGTDTRSGSPVSRILIAERHPTSLTYRFDQRAANGVDIDGIYNRTPHSPETATGQSVSASTATTLSAALSAAHSRTHQTALPSDRAPADPERQHCGVIYPPAFNIEGNPFEGVPLLRDTPQQKRLELFRKKLYICSIVYDFSIPTAFVKEKEAKRQTLCELVEYVNNAVTCFNDQIISDIVHMVAANIFRTLPNGTAANSNAPTILEPEEDEPRLESSWPHLQVVYELFRRFVVSPDTDAKIAKRYIEQTFILRLLRLFASEDPRERDYLKTILHRIYGKIMAMRSFIRKSIQHVFFETVYENEIPYGIAELLEILGSIVNGFALPLKEEHKLFLERSLIPLHKPRSFVCYHQFLAYCMAQYVEKDPRLSEVIILGLLKYWPKTNTNKEVLFINEVEEILELTHMAEFQRVMYPLFHRLAQCIESSHFQVAERVLFLWNNDHIVKLVNENRQELFPIVIRALSKNAKDHWNATVNALTYNVSKLLAQADPILFEHCNDALAYSTQRSEQRLLERERFWSELENNVSNSDVS